MPLGREGRRQNAEDSGWSRSGRAVLCKQVLHSLSPELCLLHPRASMAKSFESAKPLGGLGNRQHDQEFSRLLRLPRGIVRALVP